MAMYYLTNGKEYVAENELIPGEYIKTTYTVKAKKFTYKEGMTFKKKRWKKDKDFKKYKLINVETGEMVNPNYMGNSGAYIGDHNFDFDDGILDKIIHEADLIKSMAAWDEKQLKEYKTVLTNELSKKDSIISDIYHALLEYGDTHNGKRPQAHKMVELEISDEEIGEFLLAFNDLKEEEINGTTWIELDQNKHTKDKKVIVEKINYLMISSY